MRLITAVLFLFFSFGILAQSPNDNCDGAIDIGTIPFCDGPVLTNVGATTSNVNDIPDCFVGASVQNDVWFSFTTDDVVNNLTLTLEGVSDGPNNKAIVNPQIAIYRGNCNGLALLICQSSQTGQTNLKFPLGVALTSNTTYYIQVNNYSENPSDDNTGDFTLCIEEADPIINMGAVANTDACSGRLYDSGGPGGNYRANEDFSFVICPSNPHECIQLDVESFRIDDFDRLRFYAGDNISAPLLAEVSGNDIGTGFRVLASSECVTVRFTSNNTLSFEGFDLTWECLAAPCMSSTIDNPTVIGSLPFNANGLSTCDGGATFVNSPCIDANFLHGPEYVFEYNAPGNTCTSIALSGAQPETGILVLDGPPEAINTSCIATSQTGVLTNVDMRNGGTYYIVVANAQGCSEFDIEVEEVECMLSPALRSALCNPINDCLASVDEPFNIQIENGFRDLTIDTEINGGCWLNDGEEPDYFWFTVQAANPGDFGLILESAGAPSDIDFNVWGPFSSEQVCENANQVINFIQTNQPIRSSWSSVDNPTGMARVHPFNGTPVEDTYDCGSTPSGQGDQFVLPIEMNTGEVYVVLLNDWGNNVGEEGITVDWSPTDPGVLDQIPTFVMPTDTAICEGESVQFFLKNYSNEVRWFGNTNTLSCLDCPNPIATPTETTLYTAAVEKACNIDTVAIEVAIFEVNAGPNRTVCVGEDFQIIAGQEFDNATYEWSVTNDAFSNLVSFSCTDCPDPVITAESTATPSASTSLNIRVRLVSDNCTLQDQMRLTIQPQTAPNFSISNDVDICLGESVNLGDDGNSNGQTYSWTSQPIGFISQSANPEVSPTETTTYFVSVDNGSCPSPSLDSVKVTVFTEPTLALTQSDTTICEGDVIILADLPLEEGVSYQWQGIEEIFTPSNPNTPIRPSSTSEYTLTATRGACVVSESVNIEVTPIEAEIQQGDLLRICKGSEDTIRVDIRPMDAIPTWTASDGSVDGTTTDSLIINPDRPITYYVNVENMGCSVLDSVEILIDSLPVDLSIMPQDTVICEGSPVVLESPVFEPFEFPDITFSWSPQDRGNFQSPDSLYNLVITPDTTLTYLRVTENGACIDSATTNVIVDTIPDIQITPVNPMICIGESVNVQVEVDAQLEEIMWMPMQGLSCTDCLNPTITPFSPGANTYTMQAMAGECPVSASITINVRAPFSLPAQAQICEGESIQLNNDIDPAIDYTWTSTDPNFGTVTDPAPIVSPTENTTYFLTVEDPVCGTLEAELLVEVFEVPQYQFTDVRTICSGEEVQLNSVVTEGATYTWSNTDPAAPSSNNPELTVSPAATSTYQLTIINGVCPAVRDQLTLTVIETPNLQDTELFVCEGDNLILPAEVSEDFGYRWTADNDPNFEILEPNPSVTPVENTVYTVTASNASCGEVSAQVTVNVIPSADGADISLTASSQDITLGESVTLTGEVTGIDTQFGSYTWTLGGAIIGEGASISTTPISADTLFYTLTYIQGGGVGENCSILADDIFVAVSRPPDFRVPNAFTPNNDGDNDFFNIVTNGVGTQEIVEEFRVYNRWGQIVYDNEDPSQGWDGIFNGNPAPPEVYVYYIVVRLSEGGETVERKGDVTLIR